MKKPIQIAVIIVLALLGLYWVSRRRKSCLTVNTGKFPLRWDDTRIPHGDLNIIATQYLEGDPQTNGSLVGGFFKGINTYPQEGTAKYYQNDLKAWVKTNESLPYWQVATGELLCDN